MKKVIVMTLVTILVLTLALDAFGTTQSTEVTFEVGDGYKIYIPPTATIVKDENTGAGIGAMNIYFTECHVNGVNIALETNSNFTTCWNLRGINTGNLVPYTISISPSQNLLPETDVYVSKDTGLELSLNVSEQYLRKALADTYKDTLIFSIK